jgi:hypothetical protein
VTLAEGRRRAAHKVRETRNLQGRPDRAAAGATRAPAGRAGVSVADAAGFGGGQLPCAANSPIDTFPLLCNQLGCSQPRRLVPHRR